MCTHVSPQVQTDQTLSNGAGLGGKTDPTKGEQVLGGQGRCPGCSKQRLGVGRWLPRWDKLVSDGANCLDLQRTAQKVPCCGGGFSSCTKQSAPQPRGHLAPLEPAGSQHCAATQQEPGRALPSLPLPLVCARAGKALKSVPGRLDLELGQELVNAVSCYAKGLTLHCRKRKCL